MKIPKKYSKEYFENYYLKEVLCMGATCKNVGECIMNLWADRRDSNENLIPHPTRKKIAKDLAEITIKLNREINRLHKNHNQNFPKKIPIFSLTLHYCLNNEGYPIDFDLGD